MYIMKNTLNYNKNTKKILNMNKKLKKSIEKLTNMDLYQNEDVRNTYIDHIVSKLKRGVYPTTSLNRVRSLIVKHNKIVDTKQHSRNHQELVEREEETNWGHVNLKLIRFQNQIHGNNKRKIGFEIQDSKEKINNTYKNYNYYIYFY